MKFFEHTSTYDYSFPAVSLAYFLRYPNPYSKHVLTSDVIDRYVDPETQRLHTMRLHLKKSKIPSTILRLLPKGIGGSDNSGQSYILETTTVDAKEGWMRTESRNMEWTGILSVIERQHYERDLPSEGEKVNVRTTVTFISRLGQAKRLSRARKAANEASSTSSASSSSSSSSGSDLDEEAPKRGFFSSISTVGIQRTIELIGVTRTRDAILRSKQGMNVVLERLRNGGVVGVLEGMNQDREGISSALAVRGPMRSEGTTMWRQAWLGGINNTPKYSEDDDE